MVMFPSASGLTRRRPTSERQCMARNDVDSAALRDLLTKGWAETLRKGAGGEIISIPVLLMWDAMTKFEGYWRFQECMDMAEEDYLMAGTARLWLKQKALQERRTPWGTCKFVPLPSDEAGIKLRKLKDRKNASNDRRLLRRAQAKASGSASSASASSYQPVPPPWHVSSSTSSSAAASSGQTASSDMYRVTPY